MQDLFLGLGIGHSIMLMGFVIAIGLYLGRFKIKGVSLGATWVLFVGILVGHFGLTIEPNLLHFLKEFGLILFVYSIGLQVGPGFFHSFKKGGMTMNLLAVGIVLTAVVTAYLIHVITGEELTTMTGVMSGAVTNTPGLGAAQQTMTDVSSQDASVLASGYAVAYPIGVIGVILVLILSKVLFKVDLKKEIAELEDSVDNSSKARRMHCVIENPAVFGKTIESATSALESSFVVSRMLRDSKVMVPNAETVLKEGDKLLIVTSQDNVEPISILLGKEIPMHIADWKEMKSNMKVRRLTVTKSSLTGKKISELDIRAKYGVSITRVVRSGIDLVARPNLYIQMGDILTVVGEDNGLDKLANFVGNNTKTLSHPNLIPIFAGIAVGVIFGSIPFKFPGIPQAIKLGLAGGPLIIAILIGYFGPKFKITTYTTTSANMMIREIGITMFLAAVGIGAGGNFINSIVNGGYWWILYGALITIIPTSLAAIIGRLVFKLNFYQICGLISGSCTNPPVLAFAQNAYGTDYTSVNYATVYPLAMFMRVLVAQVMILIAFA